MRCAYVPSGNGIAERSIKKIAARKHSTISEATYWYNITSKYGALQVPENKEKRGPYVVGNIVWIKTPSSRCTTKFKLRWVTGVVSHHSVEINRVPRHIKDLRPFQGPIRPSKSETNSENQIPITLGSIPLDDTPDTTRLEADDSSTDLSSSEDYVPIVPLRWSTRQKRPTRSYTVYNRVD